MTGEVRLDGGKYGEMAFLGTANSPKSGHRMAAGGKPLQLRRNLSMIAMDLKAIWEMSD